ncbi:MAG TPA: response regulator [Candidatus Saccharimonadales bacterium]|jgi:DNA-binding NarL/FixJ family response regulator
MTHILIVEDEAPLREAYQTILTTHGHKVETAADGEEALRLVHKRVPDVILLDMKLPHVSGLEFLRQLHADDSKALKAAIIVFSNQENEADIDEAYRLGAKNYIIKAWASPRNLVKIIDEVLAK